jgi:Uma2 family endonuclease
MGNISTPEALTLRWAELINDPALADLPYKMEVDLWGKIEMTPASFWHGRLRGAISAQLAQQLPDGEALTEVPLLTELGVRVPDVAWGSRAYLAENADASPAPRAPEICVAIVSQSNTDDEIREKVRAYLAAGAQEVWIVSEAGDMRVHDCNGERPASKFPVRLSLPKRASLARPDQA